MRTPNVIVIMTDQQQARSCAREGFALDTTPTQDRLAESGAWFAHAYTAAPICLPARVSMLTGCFPTATGARTNQHGAEAREPGGNMVRLMQDLGYATALIGKNHSHLHPSDFDYAREYSHGGPMGIDDRSEQELQADAWLFDLHHRSSQNPFPFPLECTQPWRIVRDTIDWIDTQESFFAWVSIPEPHNPYYVPEPYFSLFDPDGLPPVAAGRDVGRAKGVSYRYLQDLQGSAVDGLSDQMSRYRANYYGMLRLIDDQIERLVGHLQETRRLDDTLVLYVSDHGDYVGDYGLMRKGAGVPDALMRIPFLAFGGGVARSGRRPEYVSLLDIYPTVCEAVDAPIPDGVQGRSLWPILTGRQNGGEEFTSMIAEQGYGGLPAVEYSERDIEAWTDDRITFQELGDIPQGGSVRVLWKDDWKLIVSATGDIELYDLTLDPGETGNLAKDPSSRDRLVDLLSEFARRSVQFEPVPLDPKYRADANVRIRRDPRNWYKPAAE